MGTTSSKTLTSNLTGHGDRKCQQFQVLPLRYLRNPRRRLPRTTRNGLKPTRSQQKIYYYTPMHRNYAPNLLEQASGRFMETPLRRNRGIWASIWRSSMQNSGHFGKDWKWPKTTYQCSESPEPIGSTFNLSGSLGTWVSLGTKKPTKQPKGAPKMKEAGIRMWGTPHSPTWVWPSSNPA